MWKAPLLNKCTHIGSIIGGSFVEVFKLHNKGTVEEWRNKKRPAASYTELTQAAQAAKRTKQTKLNLKQSLDETG